MSVAVRDRGESPEATSNGNISIIGGKGVGVGAFLTVPGQEAHISKERDRRGSGVAFGEVVGGFRNSVLGDLGGVGENGRRGSRSSDHGHGHGRGASEWMGSE